MTFAWVPKSWYEVVRIYTVDGVTGTHYVPMLRDVPKHTHDQAVDIDVLTLSCRWIPVVQTGIPVFIDVSSPYPTRQKSAAHHVRLHQPEPWAWDLVQVI